MATRRARLTALLSGGAIPDTADYQVRLEPEGTLVGTVNEDWAVESNGGDIFQLGNASWRVLRVEPGIVRVADAKGQPPTIPFWLGEAPGRTRELAAEIGTLREATDEAGAEAVGLLRARCGEALPEARARPDRRVRRGRAQRARGGPDAAAGHSRAVLRRERGHAARRSMRPSGRGSTGRGASPCASASASGSASSCRRPRTRRRSSSRLGPQHSFPLEEVFDYLHPATRARGARSRRSSPRRCSRRAGGGTRSARCSSSGRAAAREVRRRCCACAPTTCSRAPFPRSSPAPRR